MLYQSKNLRKKVICSNHNVPEIGCGLSTIAEQLHHVATNTEKITFNNNSKNIEVTRKWVKLNRKRFLIANASVSFILIADFIEIIPYHTYYRHITCSDNAFSDIARWGFSPFDLQKNSC